MFITKLYAAILISCCLAFNVIAQDKVVNLATGERVPYITQSLPGYGYAYEVVKEAFLREGYTLKVKFYPWARANELVKQGMVEGIMPIHSDALFNESLILSASFPGDSVGLLKHKQNYYQYPSSTFEHLLESLSNQYIGVVRGSHLLPELELFPAIKLIELNRDLQSLDMLNAGRINFALIDKHTAANLMIEERPQYIGHLEFMQPSLAEKNFHVAFSKKSPNAKTLVTIFNRGLSAIRKDGTLRIIQAHHGLLPPVKDNSRVHLTIGTLDSPDMRIMKSLTAEFEREYPHIQLEWRVMEENTLRRRLLSDLALSDGQYDVMVIGNYEVPIWAKRGWIVELTGLSEDYDLSDVFSSLRSSLSVGKHLYALPFHAESIMTFYRKDLFSSAGIQMPEYPTYTDIQRIAKAIHDPEKGIYGICLRGKAGWGQNMGIITTIVNAFGGRWFNQQWEPLLNSNEWKRAVNYYHDLLTQYGPPNAAEKGYNENLQLFLQGHCGIWIDATVAAGQLYNRIYSQVSDTVGFAPAPQQKIASNWMWAWAFAIPESSKKKEAALEFIQWATSKHYIQKVAKAVDWISVPPATRQSTYESPEYRQAAPFALFVEDAVKRAADMKNATLDPVPYQGIQYVGVPEFVAFGSQVGKNMAEILRGNMSVDEALSDSQETVYKQMRASGYLK